MSLFTGLPSNELRSQKRVIKTLPQRGTSDTFIDASRNALKPGKRVSKSGKIYWETRKNRSDKAGSNI